MTCTAIHCAEELVDTGLAGEEWCDVSVCRHCRVLCPCDAFVAYAEVGQRKSLGHFVGVSHFNVDQIVLIRNYCTRHVLVVAISGEIGDDR